MSSVLLMLSSNSMSVPAPSPPAYLLSDESSESSALLRDLENANGFSNQHVSTTHSKNIVSITELEPR
ncbi:hypothetical protein QJS10_CPA08g01396 [Acorus calamus]|uniref:Uncharacterized protein n=1 Tax=Acorus calamus TaxID=4465 RepID=A0AAV9EBE1_ACOCL|nr:hypothetical protein QJS10_CPA08g01396 [Acorus calamus]